jgi:GMP synthase-like glutamine amidotransferase
MFKTDHMLNRLLSVQRASGMILDVSNSNRNNGFSEPGSADGKSLVVSREVLGTGPTKKKVLSFAMLGCETEPPYGPNRHTAQLLLDLISMAAAAHCDNILCWSIHIHIFNIQVNEYPVDWDKYTGFIIPGSFSSAYDAEPWIIRLREVIQSHIVPYRRPVLGICFGHQILAQSFMTGRVSKIPTGARVGRHVMENTLAGSTVFEKGSLNLYFTHGDMVEKLPDVAVCLGGNAYVPIQSAAYFATAEDARRFESTGGFRASSPYCISFQAHPEYATSVSAGLEQTLDACMDAMEKRGAVESHVRTKASRDARQAFATVQRDSIEAMVQVGRLLGWFPELDYVCT